MRDPTAQPRHAVLGSAGRPVRVLLVEDDQIDRMAIERHVLRQRLPYEIVTAESGADAMQKLRARSFDIVLLDYMLGDMTGLELMPELRGTPAVFITGLGNEEIAANAIRQGAYDYLVKDQQRAYLNMLPVVIRNVLERRQVQDALRESQLRLSALLANLPGMAYRCSAGAERSLQSVSPGCVELTGYGAAELTEGGAPSFSELIVPEDRDKVAAAVAEAVGSGRPLNCSYRIQPHAGGRKWVRDRAVLVLSEAGAPVALEGYLADVSEQMHAEEIVRRAKDESEDAIRVKDRFVNLIVHDLRAPLSTCMLTVQQLRQELGVFAKAHGIADNAEGRQRFAALFDGLTERAEEMLRMIDQLLLSSRLRSGRLVPALRPVRAARIYEMVKSLSQLAEQKGIALSCELPDGFRLLADPDLLTEVVQNLLTNAIKFTRPGGSVAVSGLGPGEQGLSVRDSGVGIPAGMLARLFQHDERISTLGTAGERGTGMGLPICNDIVVAHDGRIEVRSSPGAGTEFRVHFPSARPQLLAVCLTPEDERAAQAVAERLEGELATARTSDEALESAKRRLPQAVLLDGTTPAAAWTLLGLRSNPVLLTIPALWLGGAEPPAGHIPDGRLQRPLDSEALREALRLPFGV